jgi:hypothetical protein
MLIYFNKVKNNENYYKIKFDKNYFCSYIAFCSK